MVEPILREHPQERERFHLVLSLATAPEIDYFVGRASNLASIESLLLPFTAAERKIVFLHGLGGIGKSQLAIEFAKKHRRDYTAVLWLNAKTEDTLKRSFAANARRLLKECFNQDLLDGPQDEKALSAILREMKTWLNLPGNDRWLLIYDNLDNPKIPDNKRQHAYDIRSYFPEAHQGSILVTTRWKTLRIGHPLEITKLSNDEESLSLLVRMSGRAIGEGEFLYNVISKPTLIFENRSQNQGLTKETRRSSTCTGDRWCFSGPQRYVCIRLSPPSRNIVARPSAKMPPTSFLRGSDNILNLEPFIYIHTQRGHVSSKAPRALGVL